MNAYGLIDAAPVAAWLQQMRSWLLLLLASFLDALEQARRPAAGCGGDEGFWRVRARLAARTILREMRAAVAEAEREIAFALFLSALGECIARRRADVRRPSAVRIDHRGVRMRPEARVLRPLLKAWRRRDRGDARARVSIRVRRIAAVLVDPRPAVERLVDRLIALSRELPWRTVAAPPAPACAALAIARDAPDTS